MEIVMQALYNDVPNDSGIIWWEDSEEDEEDCDD